MKENATLNTLICRRSIDLLRVQGWPEHTDIDQMSPGHWAGWITICVRLDANDLAALLTRLSDVQNISELQRAALLSAVKKLAGTDAIMVLSGNVYAAPPILPGDSTKITFPYAGEWLTEQEIQAVLACIRHAVRMICIQVADDSRHILAALTPSANPLLFTRCTRYFRVIAEEVDDENWLDESDPEAVRRVLNAILNDGARFGSVRLTVVSIVTESICAHGVITEVLRWPGEPTRRWLDRGVLREVVTLARQEIVSIMNAHRSFVKKI